MTSFELWHRHKNFEIVRTDQSERMMWGTRLQDAIAAGIASDMGWTIRRMNEYMSDSELRIGSSFDFEIDSKDSRGLLEIKNVDSLAFRDGWIDGADGIEAPPHIELQIQHQLAVSERPYAYLGALVGGNHLELVRRLPNHTVIGQIKEAVAAHWKSIIEDKPPAPDFSRDADFISKLYGFAEEGKVFDAKGNSRVNALVEEYRACVLGLKNIDEQKARLKAEILELVGDCEKVIGDGFSIFMGVVAPGRVEAFERKGYRSFRVNMKKDVK